MLQCSISQDTAGYCKAANSTKSWMISAYCNAGSTAMKADANGCCAMQKAKQVAVHYGSHNVSSPTADDLAINYFLPVSGLEGVLM